MNENPMSRHVQVFPPYDSAWGKAPALVNWSAIGSVSASEARHMASALLAAADEADRLNAQEPTP